MNEVNEETPGDIALRILRRVWRQGESIYSREIQALVEEALDDTPTTEPPRELSCQRGDTCREIILCTPKTCDWAQKGWEHRANHVRHICAHDWESGPWVDIENGGSVSCKCGMIAFIHDMRWAP